MNTGTSSLTQHYLWSHIPLIANNRTKLQNTAMILQLQTIH